MNDRELETFESELRRLRPAPPPEELQARLSEAAISKSGSCQREEAGKDIEESVRVVTSSDTGVEADPARVNWRLWLRWLMPAAATGAAVLLAVLLWPAGKAPPTETRVAKSATEWVPEEIELNRQLVAAFEGVAQLPGGIPLRFRCYDWQEQLLLRDAGGTFEIEQRNPRLEIVPVRFEVY